MNTHTTNLPAIEKHTFPNSHIISCLNLNLAQIAASGQCFRMLPVPEKPGIWSLISGTHYLEISGTPDGFFFDCPDEVLPFWKQYFDLGTDYGSFIASIRADDVYLAAAADAGSGIRILRQDLWEMMITFLISQQKTIPKIREAVEALAKKYGAKRTATLSDGTVSLESLEALPPDEAMTALTSLYGIGPKVANCVCLFGLHHIDAFPVDTWIEQILTKEYLPKHPIRYRRLPKSRLYTTIIQDFFGSYKGYAGVMQQYIFYYERSIRNGKS